MPPGTTYGSYVITATSSGDTCNTLTFTVTSAFTLGAASGYVGDSVTVTGSGFPLGGAVAFLWDGVSFGTITADGSGNITAGSLPIPSTTRGPHTVSTTSAITPRPFLVNSRITVAPTTGIVGDVITVTGSGFAAAPANVVITVDGTTITATTPLQINTVGITGIFSCTFAMPPVARGPHTIRATDSGYYAETTFSIGQRMSITPITGYVGDNVTASGSGFAANKVITFKIDGVALTVTGNSTSDQTGAFNGVNFVIPSVGGGAHTIRATDADGNYYEATLTVLTRISSITPNSGTVGTQITIIGNGFGAGLGVDVFWDAGTTRIATTTATASGTISVTFASPASAFGSHVVTVKDTLNNSATTSFSTTPKILLSPITGVYGDTITVTFIGFTANGTITSNSPTFGIVSGSTFYPVAATPSTITMDANGGGTATFSIINAANGPWTLQVSDSGGGSASAALAINQKITLNVATGVAGDVVIVTGTGFAASKPITANYGTLPLTLTFNQGSTGTDSNGSFAALFTVPATAAGAATIKVGDGPNVTGNTATATFTSSAKATISKTTTQTDPGNVGMELTVSGTGFKASSTITVTFEPTLVTVATVTSEASGSFTATFKVPVAAAGNHTIKVTDGTTTKEFAFYMDSTAPVAPGLLLPIDKFKPKQPVPFTWNAVTDPSGVTYTFQISQDAAFATLILEKKDLAVTTYKMTDAEKLKSSGSKTPYYWRVRATDQAGNVGAWSTSNTFTIGFIWPPWIIHVWYGIGIAVALILGLWLGRRMAYQSY
ncbi:MAG: hypothetical protein C4542_00230 [Dehalococcoidia bacterium]|nr:MAG: hypothetical protein C4542_00230 [Dehalococcoidia bacterium]